MKVLRLAIFLTGVTGLLAGGVMTLSSLRSGQEEATVHSNEYLKSQATEYVNEFFGMLEAVRNINAIQTNVPSYVMDRGVVKLNQGVPSEFESFVNSDSSVSNSPNNNSQVDFGLQERVLAALKNDISLSDLQVTRQALGSYSLSDISNKEGIYYVTPIYKANNGVTDPNTIEKLSVTLIDPAKAFAGLQKISSSRDASAYLISKKGKVLAHSLSAYVGTDLSQIHSLRGTLEGLFVGAQTGSIGKYTNVDGNSEQVAFVRAGTAPFAFGVEERAHPAVLSSAWFSESVDSGAARRSIGLMFVMVAFALVAFSGISIWASRAISEQIREGRFARQGGELKPESKFTLADLTAPLLARLAPKLASKVAPSLAARSMIEVPAPKAKSPGDGSRQSAAKSTSKNISMSSAPNASTEEWTETRLPEHVENAAAIFAEVHDQKEQLKSQQREELARAVQGLSVSRDIVRDFANKIERSYTLEGVEKELVSLSSEISESPVLYFRYHRRNQSLTLSSIAGEVKINNYSHMQAYVRKDIELQVEQMADEGKVASITNYGPMNKLILSHLNVAHFEAWAVTSHPEISGQSKLVGVVVVLQAGMQSAQARPLLAKILKEAGNYLYAQGNKIRPRSSLYQSPPQISTLQDSDLS